MATTASSSLVLGKFFNSYSGKDKFARAIQYGARFCEVRIAHKDPDSALGARLLKLHKSLSVNRKAFRLCRWINDYQKLKKTWNSEEKDVFKKCFRVLAEFGFMIYAMHDNINWARAINVIDIEHQPIKDRQTYFRLTGAVAEFFYRLLVIRDNFRAQEAASTEIASPENQDSSSLVDLRELQADQHEDVLKAIKFFCDIITYLRKPLHQWTGIKYSEDWLSMAGFIASLFGMRFAWLKASG